MDALIEAAVQREPHRDAARALRSARGALLAIEGLRGISPEQFLSMREVRRMAAAQATEALAGASRRSASAQDWRAMAELQRLPRAPPEYRTLAAYPTDSTHISLSARGEVLVHLESATCSQCATEPYTTTGHPDCVIFDLAYETLTGVRMVLRPDVTAEDLRSIATPMPQGAIADCDLRILEDSIADKEAQGLIRPLLPGERPLAINMVHVVKKVTAVPPDDAAAAYGDGNFAALFEFLGPVAEGLSAAIAAEVAKLPRGATRAAVAAAFDKGWETIPSKTKLRLVDDLRRLNAVTIDSTGMSFPALESLFRDGWQASDLMLLIDWKLGYHHLRLAPEAQLFFCFAHPRTGKLYAWTRLPMGWSRSGLVYCKHTALVAQSLRDYKTINANPTLQYCDDMIMHMRRALAERAQATARHILHTCNVTTSEDKERPADVTITAIGRLASSATQRIVPAIRNVYNALLELMVIRRLADHPDPRVRGIPLKRAQKLSGRLGFIADCTYGGRLHTAPFWFAAYQAERDRTQWVSMTTGGVQDAMSWWLDSAKTGRLRGEHFVPSNDLLVPQGAVSLGELRAGDLRHDDDLAVGARGARYSTSRSDACGGDVDAFAATIDGYAVHGSFTSDQRSWHIDTKELFAIWALLILFGGVLAGRTLAFGTDNAGNQYALNTGRCPSPSTRRVLAGIYSILDAHRINFYAVWVPRAFNRPADLLCQTSSFAASCRLAEEAKLNLVLRQWTGQATP